MSNAVSVLQGASKVDGIAEVRAGATLLIDSQQP